MLQCRSGKRTGKGAVKIAVEMVNEGLVDTSTAVKMVEPQHLDQLLHPQVLTYVSKRLLRMFLSYFSLVEAKRVITDRLRAIIKFYHAHKI